MVPKEQKIPVKKKTDLNLKGIVMQILVNIKKNPLTEGWEDRFALFPRFVGVGPEGSPMLCFGWYQQKVERTAVSAAFFRRSSNNDVPCISYEVMGN